MRVILILFDSLNRHQLGPYGGTVVTPAFDRLAARGVTHDRHYVGSLPCIPARRDMQTGRTCFFHRSWGPLEPFDISYCDVLRKAGGTSHLITDHFHYFEPGGGGYHDRFDSWEFMRGQEFDPWTPTPGASAEGFSPRHYDPARFPGRARHLANRARMADEEDMPLPRCFAAADRFLDRMGNEDNWLLQLELFDPHEPFHVPERYRRPGDSDYAGPVLDWPDYRELAETPAEIAEIRANQAALLRMCDHYLGRLLDRMDAQDMWRDTAVILTTDHGFLLGEHGWWGKSRMPCYEEISHIPLIVARPGAGTQAGSRRADLTQTPDLAPSLLTLFGISPPAAMTGRTFPCLGGPSEPGRIVAFGLFAGPVGVTDGRYVLLHYPPDLGAPGLNEYTLAPQHPGADFSADELAEARLVASAPGFAGWPVLRVPALPGARRPPARGRPYADLGTRLFDLAADPRQERPFRDQGIEARLYDGLRDYMARQEAPPEYVDWLGLE
ncbi:MAG: sulfatase [Pseudooceanicola sp.]|nr:sulfatase [Pseudooceanicola sp.]